MFEMYVANRFATDHYLGLGSLTFRKMFRPRPLDGLGITLCLAVSLTPACLSFCRTICQGRAPWELRPEQIVPVTTPTGSPVILGHGGFGEVGQGLRFALHFQSGTLPESDSGLRLMDLGIGCGANRNRGGRIQLW
jgi:hypothetical protein